MKRRLLAAGIAASALALTSCANNGGGGGADAEFPSDDIRLVVPWAAGGDGDLSARTLAPIMEEELGTDIVVENRPGANGSIGFQWVLDQPADGHSISMGSMESATLQFQGYDITPEDYKFVGQASSSPGAIAVPADSPYDTLEDLVAAAENDPGKLTYSTPGTGSVWDLAAHKFMVATDTDMSDVPFDGTAPSVEAAAGGHVDITFNPIGFIGPQVDSGNLKFLAMLTEERHPDYPDVPTATELGYEVVHSAWVGMKVPAETPDEVVEVLSDAMKTAVESDEFTEVIENQNMVPTVRPFPEMDEYVLDLAEESAPLFERING